MVLNPLNRNNLEQLALKGLSIIHSLQLHPKASLGILSQLYFMCAFTAGTCLWRMYCKRTSAKSLFNMRNSVIQFTICDCPLGHFSDSEYVL